MKDHRKYSINFDLSMDELKKHYSFEHPEGAYLKIRRFFEDNGYTHVQGSGYHSTENISLQKNYDVLKELTDKYEWVQYSVKSMFVTELGESYDATHVCRKDASVEHNESEEIKKEKRYDRSRDNIEKKHTVDEEYEF